MSKKEQIIEEIRKIYDPELPVNIYELGLIYDVTVENDNFANGSIKIAEKIIKNNKSNKIYSVAGGGDTVSLLNNLNAINNFNFVSTAGGAFLEYLEGKELPGIKALN